MPPKKPKVYVKPGEDEAESETHHAGTHDAAATSAQSNSDLADLIRTIIREEISVVVSQLKTIKEDISGCVKRIDEVDEALSSVEERVAHLETACEEMRKTNLELKDKVERLEMHSRKQNVRVFGLTTDIEKGNPTTYMSKLFKEAFEEKLQSAPEVEVAHRVGPAGKAKERAMIVRLQNRAAREEILKIAKKDGMLQIRGMNLRIFPDLTSEMAKKRAGFKEIRAKLRDAGHQTHLDSIFMMLEDNMVTFMKEELKKMKKLLSPDYPECSESEWEDEDEEQRSSRESFLRITLDFLRRMKQEELAQRLWSRISAGVCQQKLKCDLKKRFQCVFEGVSKQGESTLLNQIYTELHITEGGTAEVNQEHEVRQIETASRTADRAETSIKPGDIFKGPPGRSQPIRTVLTTGVAGIGKTVLTQKFTLDWAEDKDNQDVHFTFPFTFRELNVLKEKKFSLVGLVHHFFTQIKDAGLHSFEDFQVIFIFDGLDEWRLPLDFHQTEILTDVTESTSVDVLLINLIRGKLLPSAHLWITTRPAAANQIPADCVDIVTEVRGFTDPQKEEYFRRRFREEEEASRILSHIKTSRSLHIMCHIPVFCWITATVLEKVLKSREGGELPKTLTQMYIHHLVVQAKVKMVKYGGGAATDPHWSPESREMIESLGKLAFDQLQKENLIFYEPDLTECGIDLKAASMYSGMFTQIFREESDLYQNIVFCFIHLSLQEFLAALHVHQIFINSGINLLDEQQQPSRWSNLLKQKPKLHLLHQRAVDEALKSPKGHLDLFLRFLLGLSLETNQSLLRGLLTQTGSSSQSNQETVQYIKKKLSEGLSAERSINLLHCLNELNDGSLVEQIQQSLRSGRLSTDELSPAQWSALVFILLSSEEVLKEFDLKKYFASEEALLRLLPVVKASNKALLSGCGLSERSCAALSSVISSQSSHLRELDLSYNHPGDSGVKLLSAAVEDPHCSLETLRLSCCGLSERSCGALSSVLSSQSSSLTHLDLSNNDLQDSGVKRLSLGLESPHCKLEALSLSGCLVSEEGCASLVSAVRSKSSHLRELDLSYNHPGASGVKLLSAAVEDPHCKLETLRWEGWSIECPGCVGSSWISVALLKETCESSMERNGDVVKLVLIKERRFVGLGML
ncbi:protein NLRC3-like [Salarias fasciatus]|uniref:protein NLRC3-like n=1 Tax=Salarias fasciatus TaxID=181472 RepID=UPI001176683D|nr:protein NLRC3-like [Salarias fasciatus]